MLVLKDRMGPRRQPSVLLVITRAQSVARPAPTRDVPVANTVRRWGCRIRQAVRVAPSAPQGSLVPLALQTLAVRLALRAHRDCYKLPLVKASATDVPRAHLVHLLECQTLPVAQAVRFALQVSSVASVRPTQAGHRVPIVFLVDTLGYQVRANVLTAPVAATVLLLEHQSVLGVLPELGAPPRQ